MQLVVAHEGPEVQLFRRALQLLDLGPVLFILLELFLKAALPLENKKAVVAAVKFGPAVHDLDAALRDDVEEIAVVADRKHRALEVQDIILQPFGGVQVKVVGRLVEQQDVRILEDQPREVHARSLAARERVEGLLPHGGRDVETARDAAALGVHLPAAETAELLRERVVLPQQGGGGVVLHLPGELVEPRGDLIQAALRVAQHVLGRPAVGEDGDLGDQPDPLTRRDGGLALVRALETAEDAEERRLAAAVGPEDADMLAGVDREGEPVEYFFAYLEGFFEVLYVDVYHGVIPLPRSPRAGSGWPRARRRQARCRRARSRPQRRRGERGRPESR